jgi:hypothetical protein
MTRGTHLAMVAQWALHMEDLLSTAIWLYSVCRHPLSSAATSAAERPDGRRASRALELQPDTLDDGRIVAGDDVIDGIRQLF